MSSNASRAGRSRSRARARSRRGTSSVPRRRAARSVPLRAMPLTREGRGTGLMLAVDLVNTWDLLEPEPDLIEGLDDVRVWLGWHGLDRAAAQMREPDVDRVRALRTRFDEIFDAP